MNRFGRALAIGAVWGLSAWPACAADSTVDPDSVPRIVGGRADGRVVGGAASNPVIPYGQPPIPAGAVQKPMRGSVPDLSGIYAHAARVYQNPSPTSGVGPGLATAPTALTLYPEERTDNLGSRGDYLSPLLRPWAAELVKQFGEAEHASQPYFELCTLNRGLLQTWALNRGVQLVQTAERVYLFFGQDVSRIIFLNAKHPVSVKPSVGGHSIGHWEGDTLVVDTIGFDGTAEGDRYGTPTSDEMHVVERMSLRHGAQVLQVDFWVDDPVVYTQPWTSSVTNPRTEKLGREYVCRESRIYGKGVRRGT